MYHKYFYFNSNLMFCVWSLSDKPKSKVHGGITNGMFQGVIYDEDDEYHIEQAKYHLDEASLPDGEAHSVIYKASDVTHPDNGGCGLNDRVSKWMNKIQNSRVDENKREKRVQTWFALFCYEYITMLL